jgi:hypothetical protein
MPAMGNTGDQPRAIGFRCHSGWAVAVVVAGSARSPVIIDRRRVELIPERLPRQPYHAVAEAGARPAVIAQVVRAAQASVAALLRSAGGVASVGVVAIPRDLPSSFERILASHALLHAAEGRLYEQAVIDAGNDAGLTVHVVDPKTLIVPDKVERLRQSIGPPWQRDHKWAAVAGLAALMSP